MNPTELEGLRYGPFPWRVSFDAVADFVQITGDDPERWSETAPPGFAAAALFAVAPDLLARLYAHSVIHGEQTFEWNRALSIGSLLQAEGVVTRVRERGGVNFITFELEARDGSDVVVAGRSLFLITEGGAASGESQAEASEPHHSYRGDPGPGQLAASRADLVRYASATRDWNPVHWDHEAGVAAGFPGVVVHGLLQAGWALRIASSTTDAIRPFSSARFRFRNPLPPARPVGHTLDRRDHSAEIVILDDETEYLTATINLVDE
jgi:hydroxyacyl-ACP dehydratase HTD2-like protein with hotdog domain